MRIISKIARRIFSFSSGTPGALMLASPRKEDPYSAVKMKASFEGLVAKAYNARATAIRLQSDSPMSHVQFVVDRKWVVPCDPWHRKYANEFIKIAYDLCKGKDRPYAANASKSLFIDESKSALYGSMEALYLEFSPLAGDRQQLLIHVIYNKSTQ